MADTAKLENEKLEEIPEHKNVALLPEPPTAVGAASATPEPPTEVGAASATPVAADETVAKADANLEEWMKSGGLELAIPEAMSAMDAKVQEPELDSVATVTLGPNPMWDQVNEIMNQPVCRKCLVPCSTDRLVNKSKGEPRVNVVCKSCNASATMLSRQLGSWPIPAFKGMSQDQQVGFWKKCYDIIQKQGKLDYGSLRATLCMTLEEKESEIAKAEFTSDFKPVDVWVKEGYKEEWVKAGLKEIHPIMGETFAIPLKRISKAYIKERVETMLTSFEGQARRKKTNRADVPPCKIQELPNEEESIQALQWLPEESPSKKRPLDTTAGGEPLDKPDPKKVRLEAAALRKHNADVAKLARKGLSQMNTFTEVLQRFEANSRLLPAASVDDLEWCKRQIDGTIKVCQAGLKDVAPGERLEDLPFDAKGFQEDAKKIKDTFSDVDRLLKVLTKVNQNKKAK